jgi:tetratricopeptide (TPR) repeat protein
MRLAQELDPLSLPISKDMGWAFYFARKYDEAAEHVSRCIEVDPNFVRAHILLGTIYRQKGMYYESINEFQEAATLHGGMTEIVAEFACTYAMAGKHEKARQILEQLTDPSKQKYVSPYDIATIYTCLGETEEAFDWLSRACEERSGLLVYLKVEPMLDRLRSDPRFTELLRRVGHAS